MTKATQYTPFRERFRKCTRTTKTLFSGFRSTATKVSIRSEDSATKNPSTSSSALPSGLWTSRRGAKDAAKKKMDQLGGSWGVVRVGEMYCEVEQTYFRVHNVKPEWVRRDWKWLIGR